MFEFQTLAICNIIRFPSHTLRNVRITTLQAMKGSTPKKSSSSKAKNKANGESLELSFVGADQLILMVEIHKKILAFRDIMDLAPCNSSASLREVLYILFLSIQTNDSMHSLTIYSCLLHKIDFHLSHCRW